MKEVAEFSMGEEDRFRFESPANERGRHLDWPLIGRRTIDRLKNSNYNQESKNTMDN